MNQNSTPVSAIESTVCDYVLAVLWLFVIQPCVLSAWENPFGVKSNRIDGCSMVWCVKNLDEQQVVCFCQFGSYNSAEVQSAFDSLERWANAHDPYNDQVLARLGL